MSKTQKGNVLMNIFSKDILFIIKRILICLLVLVVQYVLSDKLRIFGVAPNIVFAFVIAIAFINDISFNMYAAILLGFALDGLSGRIFGIYMLTFVVLNFLVSEFYHSAFSENFLIETLYGLIAMTVYSFLFAFFTSIFNGGLINILTRIAIVECFYNFAIFETFLIIQKRFRKKKKSIFLN